MSEGQPVYNVYDGWELIGEYAPGSLSPTNAYLAGTNGLVKNLVTNNYYYQDASGSTSHLADNTGHLLEWYRYDLQGKPLFYDSLNNQLSASNYSVRHLFTGQQWYSELGLYDLRNRFYSPDIGRFLQSDPLRFAGEDPNLYRHCGNNPAKFEDALGLYYWDINVSFGTPIFVGITAGVQFNDIAAYPYLGAGAVTPGPSVSVTYSNEDPAPGVWSGALQVAAGVAWQGGRSGGANGDRFQEVGFGTPGASFTGYYTWGPTWGPYFPYTSAGATPPVSNNSGVPRDVNGVPLINPATGKPYTPAEWKAMNPVIVTASSMTGIFAGSGGVFSGAGSGTGGVGPVFSGAGGVNLGGGGQYGTGYGMGGSQAGYSAGAYASLLSAALSMSMPFLGGAQEPTHGSSFD